MVCHLANQSFDRVGEFQSGIHSSLATALSLRSVYSTDPDKVAFSLDSNKEFDLVALEGKGANFSLFVPF